MPQTFKIDQAATFSGVVLLSIEPKPVFGSTDVQDTTSDGVPKWEAQVVAGFRQFGKTVNEVLKIGLTRHGNPMEGLTPYTPVELVDLEVGVMPKERKDRDTGQSEMVGVTVWYRCAEIRSTAASNGSRKSYAMVGSADSGS